MNENTLDIDKLPVFELPKGVKVENMEVAEMVNQGTIVVSEEESAGVPMKLFQGEILLTNAWKQFCERELHE